MSVPRSSWRRGVTIHPTESSAIDWVTNGLLILNSSKPMNTLSERSNPRQNPQNTLGLELSLQMMSASYPRDNHDVMGFSNRSPICPPRCFGRYSLLCPPGMRMLPRKDTAGTAFHPSKIFALNPAVTSENPSCSYPFAVRVEPGSLKAQFRIVGKAPSQH